MKKHHSFLALVFLLEGLFLPEQMLLAQSQKPAVDPSYFESYSWRNIGPNRGGRSLGAAFSQVKWHNPLP